MLFNPDSMPEFKGKRPKGKKGLISKGSPYRHSLRQKEKSKHRGPSSYVASKVEKRKS